MISEFKKISKLLSLCVVLSGFLLSCSNYDMEDPDLEFVPIELIGKWVDSVNINATTYEKRELILNKNSSFVAVTATYVRKAEGNDLKKTEQLSGGFVEFIVGIEFFVKLKQTVEYENGDRLSTSKNVDEVLFPNCKYKIENDILELKFDNQNKTETRKYKRFVIV